MKNWGGLILSPIYEFMTFLLLRGYYSLGGGVGLSQDRIAFIPHLLRPLGLLFYSLLFSSVFVFVFVFVCWCLCLCLCAGLCCPVFAFIPHLLRPLCLLFYSLLSFCFPMLHCIHPANVYPLLVCDVLFCLHSTHVFPSMVVFVLCCFVQFLRCGVLQCVLFFCAVLWLEVLYRIIFNRHILAFYLEQFLLWCCAVLLSCCNAALLISHSFHIYLSPAARVLLLLLLL